MRSTQAESTPHNSQFPKRQGPIHWIPPFIAGMFKQARTMTSTVIKIRDETTGEDRTFTGASPPTSPVASPTSLAACIVVLDLDVVAGNTS